MVPKTNQLPFRSKRSRLADVSDELLPIRSNLVSECARILETRIQQGEWKDHLPGERRLAEALEVGRDTIRLALAQLEKHGILTPASAGSRRKINHDAPAIQPSPSRVRRIGVLSSANLERLPGSMLLEVDHLRTAFAGRGWILKVLSPSWYRSKRPTAQLEALLREENCHAWILHRSNEAIQQAMLNSGVPCLIRGYPYPGITLDFLDVDWSATARHAAGQLWRLGHRTVAIMTPSDHLLGVEAAVAGASGLVEDGFQTLIAKENGTREGIAKTLDRLLRAKARPTAIITTRPRQTATTITWLMSQGLQIPRDISLINLAHEPFLEHFIPKVSGYHVPPEKVARIALRRIEQLDQGQTSRRKNSLLMPNMIPGASLGKAPFT